MALATVTAIKDSEHFQLLLEESNKKLLVIDCHQNWCGPCETVRPTYNSLLTEIDDCQDRADISELTLELSDLLKGTEIDLANHGCMPFFLIVKSKLMLHTIFGADVPKLREVVNKEAPAKA